MKFLDQIIEGKLDDAKNEILNYLNNLVKVRLSEAKKYVASDMFEEVLEEAAPRRNSNIIKIGRIQKIRRRIRRNAKGRIVIQKNRRRSGVKGYKISGNTVKRISAVTRLRKARLLKRSWKTTRRAKLRRTLMKRKLSMRRRAGLGLR
jgi:hypothetical protein